MQTLPDNEWTDHTMQRMYHLMLSGWVCDLLHSHACAKWPEPEPMGDYANRDWTLLYDGSVLDD